MSSAAYDLLIKDATLVGAHAEQCGDLGIKDGRIVAIGPDLGRTARRIVERGPYFVLPGYIDAHVHLNEPGRADWEGFVTGTSALAAGGCTVFMDMPLNSTPVLDARSFQSKASCLKKNSRLDGALWGGLVPGNLRELQGMANNGAIGFKAFMSNSGMNDFPRADFETLREGMSRSVELGLPVGVHAESDEITNRFSRESQSQNKNGIRDYLDSRPIAAELEAIGQALVLAKETGCALHVVHVSSAAGLKMIGEAREAGCNVTAETCPHYLLLDETDLFRLGPAAKCAPPLRPSSEQSLLWEALARGEINTIGSDHSPSPPELKTSENFFEVWGGIASCQHNFPLFFEEAVLNRGLPASLVARLTSLNVAKRFGLPRKGDIQVGWDADMVVLQVIDRAHEIESNELLTRHRYSAYTGRSTRVSVAMTIATGRVVSGSDEESTAGSAQILRPQRFP